MPQLKPDILGSDAESVLAQRALTAAPALQQQAASQQSGIGDFLKVLIPIIGPIVFGSQIKQKYEQLQQTRQLQQGLAQSLTQQGLYDLLPAIHGKLTDKDTSTMLTNMSMLNRLKRQQLNAPLQEFQQQGSFNIPQQFSQAMQTPSGTQLPPGSQLQASTPLEAAQGEQAFSQQLPLQYAQILQQRAGTPAAKDALEFSLKSREEQRKSQAQQQFQQLLQPATRPAAQSAAQLPPRAGDQASGLQEQITRPAGVLPGPGTPQLKHQIIAKAQELGIDPALALALAHRESSFNPRAVSRTGVTGLYQVTMPTGTKYGQTAANRTDPAVSTHAGLSYLRDLLQEEGGDVRKALARYGDPAEKDFADKVLRHYPMYANVIGRPGDAPQLGAAPAQPPASTTQALPPFRIDPRRGARITPEGGSIDLGEAARTSSATYLDQALATDPAQVPQALHNIYTGGGDISTEKYKQVATATTRSTFLQQLQRPEIASIADPNARFQAAFNATTQALNPPTLHTGGALFDPAALEGFRDPIALKLATEQAGALGTNIGRGQYVTGQVGPAGLASQERAIQTQQAGAETAAKTQAQLTAEFDTKKTQQLEVADPARAGRYFVAKPVEFVNDKGQVQRTFQQGQRIAGIPYGDAIKGIEAGQVMLLEPPAAKSMELLQHITPTINEIITRLNGLYGAGGLYEDLSGKGRLVAGTLAIPTKALQESPDYEVLKRALDAFTTQAGRLLGDESRQSDLDTQRYRAILPQVTGLFPDTAQTAHALASLLSRTLREDIARRLNIQPHEVTSIPEPTFSTKSRSIRRVQ